MADSVTFKIDGMEQIEERFDQLTPKMASGIRRVLNAGALKVKSTAQKNILDTSYWKMDFRYSGKDENRKSGGRRVVTVSKPGAAPNSDTGNLARNITVSSGTGIFSKVYTVLIRSRAKYSQALEFGTKDMEARPFFIKSFKEHRGWIRKGLERVRQKALNDH